MRTWTVVYQGTQREEIIEEGLLGPEALANFDRAAKAGRINGRVITGMWITAHPPIERSVLRIYGRVGRDIHSRHAASQSR